METLTTPAPAASQLTHRETLWIVAGVLLPVFMASLDQSLVATALPTIGREFDATGQLSWVVTAYLLTSTAATPLYGKISDTRGRRMTMMVGIGIFVVGAIASALAPNITSLILARGLQGIGGAGLVAQAMTVLGDIAPPKQRAKYYTYFSIIYTTAAGIGPVIGGLFAEHLHWSLIFWISVPMGIGAFLITSKLLRKLPRYEKYHRLDIAAAVLIVAASSTLMLVMNTGGKTWPWLSIEIVTFSLVSVLLWVLFLRRLLRTAEPLIPLGILRNPIVRCAIVANSFGWAAMIGLNIYLPLYLQTVLGKTPSESGLNLMVLMVTVNASALVGAQVAARMEHYKLYPLVTLFICILSIAWLAVRVDTISMLEFELVLALAGLGFGPVAPVSSVALQNAVMMHQLGTAVSVMSFARSLFAAVLVAALGAIVLHAVGTDTLTGAAATLEANRDGATAAFRTLFWVTAGSLVIAFLGLLLMEERPLLTSNDARVG
ncbi:MULTISPECIES: MFS transporter [unclassified Beijerinckia]|uniref:MFS transporter n=1 Tax=unclassified Beijerinckia TaxID=2638183 RepID=UPI00089513AB|nr:MULTISPECIES: MFS transporter [unclassified Beijerinckia]MDH7797893.1 EmrB/QacA subfamily drug resistance transporter [Beijerinckia sp. GAS462]SED02040.1 drug resistance transporter, EmrB/QacA subfamily [Beijerinckia sp. 28-YEA-48]